MVKWYGSIELELIDQAPPDAGSGPTCSSPARLRPRQDHRFDHLYSRVSPTHDSNDIVVDGWGERVELMRAMPSHLLISIPYRRVVPVSPSSPDRLSMPVLSIHPMSSACPVLACCDRSFHSCSYIIAHSILFFSPTQILST